MLERKACFEFGLKSILSLFLVFAFYAKASDAVHAEFGCEFADNQYRMKPYTNKENPVFGNTSTLDPNMDINLNIVEPLRRKVFSEPNLMNDLSVLRKFITDYKRRSNGKSMSYYFKNYDVPFKGDKEYSTTQYGIPMRKTYDPVSYLIQEFQALKAHQLQVTRRYVSPYLVSAYIDPIGIDFSRNIRKLPAELLQKRVQDHVAGIFKLSASGRKGYILMDPGYANGVKLYDPFIVYVMEDEQAPHGQYIRATRSTMNENLVFTTLGGKGGSYSPYILAKHNSAQSETRYVLYYVEKSYCSFMENTVKANIMRVNHGIVARAATGTKQGYLTLKISFKNTTAKLRNYRNRMVEVTQTNMIPQSESKEAFRNAMENAFNIPRQELLNIIEDLKYIQQNVFGNNYTMADLNGMAETLDLNKEEPENRVQNNPEPVREVRRTGSSSGSGSSSNNNMLVQKMRCCISKPKVD